MIKDITGEVKTYRIQVSEYCAEITQGIKIFTEHRTFEGEPDTWVLVTVIQTIKNKWWVYVSIQKPAKSYQAKDHETHVFIVDIPEEVYNFLKTGKREDWLEIPVHETWVEIFNKSLLSFDETW